MAGKTKSLNNLSQFIRDRDDNFSSKRLAGFIALSCIIISWILDYCGLTNGREYLTTFATITLGCFGLAASEYFSNNTKDNQ